LWKWFLATFLLIEAKKGMSANQLGRTIGVSYKTAWYLCHRIRAAMESEPIQLSGVVEVDETYIGGKVRGKGSHYVGNKAMVLGAIQRGGSVRVGISPNTYASSHILKSFVRANVADHAEAIYTDSHPGYVGIGDADTIHESVSHSTDEWVRGDVHTNSVESVWSLLKRAVVGSYHQISHKHLSAYLDEFSFRFNNRENPHKFRDTLTRLCQSQVLGYRDLVA
jgi:transposase-like protein